jgi:hypothetical protein
VGSNPTSSATKCKATLELETTSILSCRYSLYPNLSQSLNCLSNGPRNRWARPPQIKRRSAKPWYLRSEITSGLSVTRNRVDATLEQRPGSGLPARSDGFTYGALRYREKWIPVRHDPSKIANKMK